MSVRMEGLSELVADLDRAASKALPEVEKVIKKGALNIKNDARKFASGLRHAPHYPRSISYDVHSSSGGVEAEIGPDKDRVQGALGNILEYGTLNNAPITHLGPALDREGPRFTKALGDLGVELVGE